MSGDFGRRFSKGICCDLESEYLEFSLLCEGVVFRGCEGVGEVLGCLGVC